MPGSERVLNTYLPNKWIYQNIVSKGPSRKIWIINKKNTAESKKLKKNHTKGVCSTKTAWSQPLKRHDYRIYRRIPRRHMHRKPIAWAPCGVEVTMATGLRDTGGWNPHLIRRKRKEKPCKGKTQGEGDFLGYWSRSYRVYVCQNAEPHTKNACIVLYTTYSPRNSTGALLH